MAAPGAGDGSTNQTYFFKNVTDSFIDYGETPLYNIKISNIEDLSGSILKCLVIMIGAADFFYTKTNVFNNDRRELDNLVTYLKSIQAHTPVNPDEKTIVLCFDQYYTSETIDNDFKNLNDRIYAKRKSGLLSKVTFEQDYINNPEEYAFPISELSLTYKDIKDAMINKYGFSFNSASYVFSIECRIGNIFFIHYYKNFYTKINNIPSAQDLFGARDKGLSTIGDRCKPKSGSDFEKIEKYCHIMPFQEYYLYNCAWIGNEMFFQNNTDKYGLSKINSLKNTKGQTNIKIFGPPFFWKSLNPVHNRYLEHSCEFLYIFTHLPKPSFLLTANDGQHDLHTFAHKNEKQVGQLFITPINSTTTFKNNSWIVNPMSAKTIKFKAPSFKGGKRRTITRKQKKRSRKHRR